MTKTTRERIRKLIWGPDRPGSGPWTYTTKDMVALAEKEYEIAEKHAKNCRDALEIARIVERMQPC